MNFQRMMLGIYLFIKNIAKQYRDKMIKIYEIHVLQPLYTIFFDKFIAMLGAH